jgi:2-oxoisovalerate dehydrogenase E1 component alpha subunit
MVMARALDRRLWWLGRLAQQAMPASASGAEAVQVAAAACLRPGIDWVVPHRGDLALCLAMGLTPLDVMLAAMGRAADPVSGGRLAPGSFGSRHARILTTVSATGAHVLHAAGIAYASRLRGLDEVTLVSISGRAVDSGDWHEGINFAAVHRLPMVCLVEDTADQDPAPLEQPATDLLVLRSAGYGIAGDVIDGADFNDAFVVLGRAFERARSGGGPSLLHARVPALTSIDRLGSRLPRERLEAMSAEDPITLMRSDLERLLVIDPQTAEQVEADSVAVVEAAVGQARASALPKGAAALDNVFGSMADA